MYNLIEFTAELQEKVINFYSNCLLESGRKFEPEGRHQDLGKIKDSYDAFWCLEFNNNIIGTVAVNSLSYDKCELKSMYLLSKYHGNGLGQKMIDKALDYAKKNGFKEMYLDTLNTSKGAIRLYKKNGFVETIRYNNNMVADVFMKRAI
ncbi:GNAT family N-acetyltransferase [Clostridium paraputrificum]|uniref:GNAT family N-acetyltransferase n=1 Tax=Clostridium paraputrificum TaxID=29363 RepID=UPI003D327EB4